MTPIPASAEELPLGYTVTDSAKRVPCSRAEMYNRINRGEIRAKKLGKRTIILREDLQAYLVNLPDYKPAAV